MLVRSEVSLPLLLILYMLYIKLTILGIDSLFAKISLTAR